MRSTPRAVAPGPFALVVVEEALEVEHVERLHRGLELAARVGGEDGGRRVAGRMAVQVLAAERLHRRLVLRAAVRRRRRRHPRGREDGVDGPVVGPAARGEVRQAEAQGAGPRRRPQGLVHESHGREVVRHEADHLQGGDSSHLQGVHEVVVRHCNGVVVNAVVVKVAPLSAAAAAHRREALLVQRQRRRRGEVHAESLPHLHGEHLEGGRNPAEAADVAAVVPVQSPGLLVNEIIDQRHARQRSEDLRHRSDMHS